jgi:hypothetical protein
MLQKAISALIAVARVAPAELCESGLLDGIQESDGEMSDESAALLQELCAILEWKSPH